jgi:3-deoxy-D-manno-octulosonate 8-phosphate phosphatase (KDO 8-P phosphatase)
MDTSFKVYLTKIKAFVFDVDGVLTDGSLLVMADGEFLRRMNIKDGYAMQLAVKKGYRIAVISGGHSTGVPKRLERLGLTEVHMGVKDKLEVYNSMLQRQQIEASEVLCMGDDMPDIPILTRSGLATCPSDAVPEIKAVSHYISEVPGGHGCVRDVIRQVMLAQGTWE